MCPRKADALHETCRLGLHESALRDGVAHGRAAGVQSLPAHVSALRGRMFSTGHQVRDCTCLRPGKADTSAGAHRPGLHASAPSEVGCFPPGTNDGTARVCVPGRRTLGRGRIVLDCTRLRVQGRTFSPGASHGTAYVCAPLRSGCVRPHTGDLGCTCLRPGTVDTAPERIVLDCTRLRERSVVRSVGNQTPGAGLHVSSLSRSGKESIM